MLSVTRHWQSALVITGVRSKGGGAPHPPLEIFHLPLTPSLCLSSNHSQYFCVAIVMHQTSTPSMHVYPHHDNNPFCNYSTNSILAAVAAFLVKAKSESARVEIRRTSKIPRWPILIRSPPLRHASWRRCSFDALTPDFFFFYFELEQNPWFNGFLVPYFMLCPFLEGAPPPLQWNPAYATSSQCISRQRRLAHVTSHVMCCQGYGAAAVKWRSNCWRRRNSARLGLKLCF